MIIKNTSKADLKIGDTMGGVVIRVALNKQSIETGEIVVIPGKIALVQGGFEKVELIVFDAEKMFYANFFELGAELKSLFKGVWMS